MIVDYGGFVHPYRGNSYPSRPLGGRLEANFSQSQH